MNLPLSFVREMTQLFSRFDMEAELPAFWASFKQPACTGLRANTLKINPLALQVYLAGCQDASTGLLPPVPWSQDGFHTSPELQPGRLAAHAAGLYYIQEPSAMLPADVLAVSPGTRVLDLCAAPGGKATRLAADLQGSGLLWANEISRQRVRALQRTIELTGCTNAIITSETPDRLAERLSGWFDAVLTDVPCSGAGMFRRDPAAVRSYRQYGRATCLPLQRAILEAAWQMLRPGGRLVYATCTFSLAENEAMIDWFCGRHADCCILPINKAPGVDDGLPLTEPLRLTARIWPHRSAGDGHFCALLGKTGHAVSDFVPFSSSKEACADWQLFQSFCEATLTLSGQLRVAELLQKGIKRVEHDHLHVLPACPAVLDAYYKVKTGLFLGKIRRKRGQAIRFEPSQAFLLSLRGEDIRYTVSGKEGSILIRRYLRGETLENPPTLPVDKWPDGATGAVLLDAGKDCQPLGWIRQMMPNMLKNLYPQGWTRPF